MWMDDTVAWGRILGRMKREKLRGIMGKETLEGWMKEG